MCAKLRKIYEISNFSFVYDKILHYANPLSHIPHSVATTWERIPQYLWNLPKITLPLQEKTEINNSTFQQFNNLKVEKGNNWIQI